MCEKIEGRKNLLISVPSTSFSLEEECEAPLCTAALTAKNQELQSDVKKVTSVFEKLQNYINLLALPCKVTSNHVSNLAF